MLEAWALALAGSPWIFVVLYLFAAIDGFFPPIPSESIVIALAALAISTGAPNLWTVMLVAALGAFTGDQIAYQIGTKVKVREIPLLRSRRGQAAVDWAENALANRGAAFIIAARYIPVGRVAVNMTAGAVRYNRRRFVGLTAIAAVSWAIYATLIGIGAGAWLGQHALVAVGVGIVGGLALGIVIDWILRRFTRPAGRAAAATDAAATDAAAADAGDAAESDPPDGSPAEPPAVVPAPVTGRSRSDPAA